MGRTLILTDDAVRGGRLARNLGGADVAVYDLYGTDPVPAGASLILGDLSNTASESMLRMRRALADARGPDVPFLYLVHGNAKRGEIQAAALGATRTLPASTVTAMLLNAVASLGGREPAPPTLGPARLVEEARTAFAAIFTADGPPPPERVEAGTDLVNRAIRETDVRSWLDMVARFDDATHRHCLMVAGLTASFGQTLRLNREDSQRLTRGALLHDIGKAQVPIAILNKPGPLTREERREMDKHPVLGHAMLAGGGYDAAMLAVVRSHHELLDGSGYPDGLSGDEIPDLVRLVTVCDIFAALIERRPYKAPKTNAQAYGILTEMDGKLDADLVQAFGAVAAACDGPPRRASA